MPLRGHEKMHLLNKLCIDAYKKLARVGNEKIEHLPVQHPMALPVRKVKKQKKTVDKKAISTKISNRIVVNQQSVVAERSRALNQRQDESEHSCKRCDSEI